MNEMEVEHLKEYELKLADTDDIVAQRVGWHARNPGGSSFKSQKLVVSSDKIFIKGSTSMGIFKTLFIVPVIVVFIVGIYFSFFGNTAMGVFMICFCVMFGGMSYFTLSRFDKKFTIDKFNGTYYVGKEFDIVNQKDRMVQGYIKEIYAIQLIKERISSNSSSGSYNSYEMNLVFKDGERLNIMDHGSSKDVDASAIKLGDILNIPIWKAQF
jgi:hypothetical protein